MRCPSIHVVVDTGSRDLPLADVLAWFFDAGEAEEWRERNQPAGHWWEIQEVPAGGTEGEEQ